MDLWMIIVLAIIAIAAVATIFWFIALPSATKIANLKEWLKWAVVEAERALGSGTGQLKLRMVYDAAVAKFPWLSAISFTSFSSWVDEALEWMRAQLSENNATQNYVEKK